ncbi:MAG: hypothetical protein PVI54_16125, partial [Desulfobacteraceae bacterium]
MRKFCLAIVFFICTYTITAVTAGENKGRDFFEATVKHENLTPYIPPQCYTKTRGQGKLVHNTCYACHTHGIKPNYTFDQDLQEEYAFPQDAEANPYKNLFKDRSSQIAAISDQTIIDYVRSSNYFDADGRLALARTLKNVPAQWDVNGDGKWAGYMPDCYFNFDGDGFDRDPSKKLTGWRALAFYPFPTTYWPTNGSFSDVLVRLPEPFRKHKQKFDLNVYKLNLAILEALIKRTDITIDLTDEALYGVDLNKDGKLGKANMVVYDWAPKQGKYMYYVGDAYALQQKGKVHLAAGLFPEGTEFLSTLRYLDISDEKGTGDGVRLSRRMKELRYLKKTKWVTYADLHLIALAEDKEKHDFPDRLKVPFGDRERGLKNGRGWTVQGFIEAVDGQLRPLDVSETMSCIGCHGEMGSSADSIVSFVRKLDVSNYQQGWFHWSQKDLKGINEPKVAFKAAGTQYEYCYYLMYALAGDEFRANGEVSQKFFDSKGKLRPDMAENIHEDVSILLYPSKQRALALNKVYKTIVEEQSYLHGKYPLLGVAVNVFDRIKPEDEMTGVNDPVVLTHHPEDILSNPASTSVTEIDVTLTRAVDGNGMGGPNGERYGINGGGLIDESNYAVTQSGFYFPFPPRHTLPTRIIVPNANTPACYTCHRLPAVMAPPDPQPNVAVPLPASDAGSRMRQLTSDSGIDTNAVWRPDGRAIAWSSNRSEGFQIWTMNSDGSRKRQVTHGPEIHGWPQWSPDGKRLLFWGFNAKKGSSTISICNPDGTGVKILLEQRQGRLDRPTWRPDGKYIAYAAQDDRGNWDVWVAAVDGSKFYRMTQDTQMETNPLWSPDGMSMAYKVAPNKAYNLTIENFINVEKGFDNPTYRLWDGIKSIQMNDWSPDGRYITYTAEAVTNASGEDRVSYLAVVEDVHMSGSKTSGKPIVLSKSLTLGDRGPRFSPDGKQIVFWAWDRDYRATLWLAHADGSQMRRLTREGFDMYPSWHPNGQTIVFESGRSGNLDIWAM